MQEIDFTAQNKSFWRIEERMKYDFIPDSVSEHTNVYDVLKERGFIEQSTDEEKVRELLQNEKGEILHWL